jgi:hypothetical protein
MFRIEGRKTMNKYIVTWIGDCGIEAENEQEAVEKMMKQDDLVVVCSSFKVKLMQDFAVLGKGEL